MKHLYSSNVAVFLFVVPTHHTNKMRKSVMVCYLFKNFIILQVGFAFFLQMHSDCFTVRVFFFSFFVVAFFRINSKCALAKVIIRLRCFATNYLGPNGRRSSKCQLVIGAFALDLCMCFLNVVQLSAVFCSLQFLCVCLKYHFNAHLFSCRLFAICFTFYAI